MKSTRKRSKLIMPRCAWERPGKLIILNHAPPRPTPWLSKSPEHRQDYFMFYTEELYFMPYRGYLFQKSPHYHLTDGWL